VNQKERTMGKKKEKPKRTEKKSEGEKIEQRVSIF
jgi:hypothetical protein